MTRPDSLDVVPLGDRLLYLTWFRLAVVLVVLGFLPFLDLPPAVPRAVFVAATIAWPLVATLVSNALWASGRRNLPIVSALLLTDGVHLVAVAHVGGGLPGPLAALVPLHLVTVSLLVSFRTALKLALWHSLLLLVVRDAAAAGLLPAVGTMPGMPGGPSSAVQFAGVLTGAWLSTLASCGFAAVNERELRRRRYDLEALAEFSAALERALAPAEIAQLLADNAVERFDALRAVVLLAGPEPLARTSPAGWAPTDPAHVPAYVGPDGSLLRPGPGRAAHESALVTHVDAAADPWLNAVLGRHANLVVLPLSDGDTELGVLVLEHGTRRGSGIERRLVSINERAVSQAGLALVKAALLEELQALATTDALTGAANRGTFDRVLETGLAEAARHQDTLSLVMVDVDHFKGINDTHGHGTGDDVLRALAAALGSATRTEDLVARYGGEEFAVVLPGLATDEALAVGERLRALVTTMAGPVPVTASFGVATYPADGTDRRALTLAADQALYRAKRAGRDRVCGPAGTSSAGAPEGHGEGAHDVAQDSPRAVDVPTARGQGRGAAPLSRTGAPV